MTRESQAGDQYAKDVSVRSANTFRVRHTAVVTYMQQTKQKQRGIGCIFYCKVKVISICCDALALSFTLKYSESLSCKYIEELALEPL